MYAEEVFRSLKEKAFSCCDTQRWLTSLEKEGKKILDISMTCIFIGQSQQIEAMIGQQEKLGH